MVQACFLIHIPFICRLFLRESISVKVSDDTSAPEVDDGVGDYQYDNPTDQASFCPNVVGKLIFFLTLLIVRAIM